MNNIENKKILIFGIITVAISFIISIIVYFQFSISDVVFLEHYYDVEIRNLSYLEFHFISNPNDDRQITDISFPQMPDDFANIKFDYLGMHRENGNYFRTVKSAHYNYNIISLEVSIPRKSIESEGKVLLDKAIVKFNNGDEREIDIGKIVLYKNIKKRMPLI